MIRWLPRFSLLFALIATLWLPGSAYAQQGDSSAAANTGQGTQQSDDADTAAASADQDDAAEEEATAQDDADTAAVGDSPTRFIPTEQVSQDLGVSFPSDI